MDIPAASIQAWIAGRTPMRMLQGIAVGWFGRSSFGLGWASAAARLATHFFIATSWAAVYWFASRRAQGLRTGTRPGALPIWLVRALELRARLDQRRGRLRDALLHRHELGGGLLVREPPAQGAGTPGMVERDGVRGAGVPGDVPDRDAALRDPPTRPADAAAGAREPADPRRLRGAADRADRARAHAEKRDHRRVRCAGAPDSRGCVAHAPRDTGQARGYECAS